MEHISLFLKKFENLGLKEFLVRESVANIISSKFKINIDVKDVGYDKGILTIKGSRSLKSELFLNKQEIIQEIENALSETKIDRVL